jgi:hypothetical protein
MFSAIINQPSHIIYGISSIKWQWIVRFTQRFFNTAGVGLCFQLQWERIFAEAGFDPVAFQRGLLCYWLGPSLRWMMTRLLFVKAISHGHFFLKPKPV